MRYWISNLYNKLNNDKRIHMTEDELRYFSGKPPEHIILHSNQRWFGGQINLNDIKCPNSLLEIRNLRVKGKNVVADELLINGKDGWYRDIGITNSTIRKIRITDAIRVELKDINQLSDIDFENVKTLLINNAQDLTALHTKTLNEVTFAIIKNTPKLKSSSSVDLFPMICEEGVKFIMKQGDYFVAEEITGSKENIFDALAKEVLQAEDNLKELELEKEDYLNQFEENKEQLLEDETEKKSWQSVVTKALENV